MFQKVYETLGQFLLIVTMLLRKLSQLKKTVAAASGIFCDLCVDEPLYRMVDQIFEGGIQEDQSVRLFFPFFLQPCKHENTLLQRSEKQSRHGE